MGHICKEFRFVFTGRLEIRSFSLEVSLNNFKIAAGLKKGSGNPKAERVAKIGRDKIREIAELKMPDLNAYDVESAMRIIEGTARSAGITVTD